MTTPSAESNATAIAQLTTATAANAEAIGQLNGAINTLVSDFIKPNAQQANANRLDLRELDKRLVSIADITAANAQGIAELKVMVRDLVGEMRQDREEVKTRIANLERKAS